MLTGLLDWIAGREPVATATGLAGVVTAGLGVAAAFGAPVTESQIAAIGAFAAVLAGWAARRVVTPVSGPAERQIARQFTNQKIGEPPPAAGETGQLGIILIVVLVVLVLAMVGLFHVCTNDHESWGPVTVTAARYDGDCDWRGDCDGDRYDQNYGSRDDRNRNRGRNRGAFSPGPFDRSPVQIDHNRVCVMPGSCPPGDGEGDGSSGPPPERTGR